MANSTTSKIGRLAMRQEGNLWNAYYALPGTMEGAIFIGSIPMRFVVDHAQRKHAFMALIQECVTDLIFEQTGSRPTWPEGPHPAPESERSGNA